MDSLDVSLLAQQFLCHTSLPVFITGKAGTGKTTFLRSLPTRISKAIVIAAPTGVAAINAGGVTLHSLFGLPFGVFIPGRNAEYLGGDVYTQQILLRKHPLSETKRKLLQSMELLVIDEVSMLRADVLDAIDFRLRVVRKRMNLPYGGVQVLFIGDLFQLSPVLRTEAAEIFGKYYPAPWFYHAEVCREAPPVYLEFTTVYRQQDQQFIELLNSLREGQIPPNFRELLAPCVGRELPGETPVTLTTHNALADQINQAALDALPGDPTCFEAIITDDFPKTMFPVPAQLYLKPGCRVMFVRNDTETRSYFNGKLATIERIQGREVLVSFDEGGQFSTKPVTWENKRYIANKVTGIPDEEVIGTFEQLPFRLAWAITIHKSQGLTFERAKLDLGESFASGQIYVALSRLRSLQGLSLSSLPPTARLLCDPEIIRYRLAQPGEELWPTQLTAGKSQFLAEALHKAFTFVELIREYQVVIMKSREERWDTELLVADQARLRGEESNTQKFLTQLEQLHDDSARQLTRLEAGVHYYQPMFREFLGRLYTWYREEVTRKDPELQKLWESLVFAMYQHLRRFIQVKYLPEFQSTGSWNPQSGAEERELEAYHRHLQAAHKKKKRNQTTPTVQQTCELLDSGLSPEEIAAYRQLTLGTIDAHLTKLVALGKVEVFDFLSEGEVAEISQALASQGRLTEIFNQLEGKYRMGLIRAVAAHLARVS